MDIKQKRARSHAKAFLCVARSKNVIIFPEGTRSKNGIKDFKETFAILSTVLNIPWFPWLFTVPIKLPT
jgi:long-chain acyl-CoA synthetase